MKKSTFLQIAVISILISCNNKEDVSQASNSDNNKKEEIENEPEETLYWRYDYRVDEMTDDTVYYAQLESENYCQMEFPYEGNTYMTLNIRNQDGKNDIYFKSDRGQLQANYGQDQTFSIRFDENKAKDYNVVGADSNDPEYAFIINNQKEIIENIKKSQLIRIQVDFYNFGKFVYKFNSKGLKWDH